MRNDFFISLADKLYDLSLDVQDFVAEHKKPVLAITGVALVAVMIVVTGKFSHPVELSAKLLSPISHFTEKAVNFVEGEKNTKEAPSSTSDFSLAEQQKMCGSIGDTISKQICLDAAIAESAKKELDPKICASISTEKSREFCEIGTTKALAVAKGDGSLCSSIKNGAEQKLCQAAVPTGSGSNLSSSGSALAESSFCTGTGSMFEECRDGEVLRTAVSKDSLEECVASITASGKAFCEFTIYQTRAMKAENPALCDPITNSLQKEECKKSVGGFSETSTGADISGSSSPSSSVSLSASESNKVCGGLENPRMEEMCLDTITLQEAVSAKNAELCTKVKNESRRNYCELTIVNEFAQHYYQSAVAYCNSITSDVTRQKCLDGISKPQTSTDDSSVATSSGSSSVDEEKCNALPDPRDRIECLRKLK